MRNRDTNFSVRISKSEKQQIDRIIQKCGLTKSAYIRMIISGYLPKETPPIEYHQIIKELNSIGNNLNQIAKIANSTGVIVSHSRKNRHKKALKNGMNRSISLICLNCPHLFHGSLDNEPLTAWLLALRQTA